MCVTYINVVYLQLCEGHLSKNEDAAHHYKAVCRAILAEARELVSFLDKISKGQEVSPLKREITTTCKCRFNLELFF